MIVASVWKVPIGSVQHEISDSLNKGRVRQPFFILREATYEEYADDVRQNGGQPPDDDGLHNFYEVSTD